MYSSIARSVVLRRRIWTIVELLKVMFSFTFLPDRSSPRKEPCKEQIIGMICISCLFLRHGHTLFCLSRTVWERQWDTGAATRALKTDLRDPDLRTLGPVLWGLTQHALKNHSRYGSRLQLARVEAKWSTWIHIGSGFSGPVWSTPLCYGALVFLKLGKIDLCPSN